LDYLKMPRMLDGQAKQFITNTTTNPQWAQEGLMSLEFQKELLDA
jgi:hypothetical protein